MLNSEPGMEEMERVTLLYAVCVCVCVCACVCMCVLSIRAPCDFEV